MTVRMSAPIEKRTSGQRGSIFPAMQAWLRLFSIELRRSPAMFAAIVIALLTWWVMRGGLRVGVVRWREISHAAGDSMIPVAAIAAAMAAFMVGREYRRRTLDQLAVTSMGRWSHDLVVGLSVLAWCIGGYLAVVAGFFVYATRYATWGGPEWGIVALTLVTIVASAAFGWLMGSLLRHRLTPLLALGATFAINAAYPMTQQFRMVEHSAPNGGVYFQYMAGWWQMLVPWEVREYATIPKAVNLSLLWMLALTVCLWSLAWWWNHRNGIALVNVALGIVIAGSAAGGLVTGEWVNPRPGYVQPVCETRLNGGITVCMHPQDTALLGESADVIASLVGPIAGIPGVPTRFEGQQSERVGSDVVLFYLYDETTITHHQLHESILRELLLQPTASMGYSATSAQYVVGVWLLENAGIRAKGIGAGPLFMPLSYIYRVDEQVKSGSIASPEQWDQPAPDSRELEAYEREVGAALMRFRAIPDDERIAWLAANWDTLRAGELTLEDLP